MCERLTPSEVGVGMNGVLDMASFLSLRYPSVA